MGTAQAVSTIAQTTPAIRSNSMLAHSFMAQARIQSPM
jgi:hypothetical protein